MLSKHLFQSQANVKIRFCLPKITFWANDWWPNDLMFIIHFFMVLLCFFPILLWKFSIIRVENKKNVGVPSSSLAASFSHVSPSYCLSPAHSCWSRVPDIVLSIDIFVSMVFLKNMFLLIFLEREKGRGRETLFHCLHSTPTEPEILACALTGNPTTVFWSKGVTWSTKLATLARD